ncbi:Uncharacterised protein [Vibrio cholerae]|uniref:Uncharacterized protein n=1 Tax=Vibrio cholerae TaxID=666 RepID=A0A655QCQ5_VIBCL|nr:Uncharacterised protein [Vibrio cholerae]CSB33550.1 Uncharacterised protein [Vibrio cholerae]CSB75506.1 Uncharacterised protein [Vibrio cholerae]CSB85243.1 Uncharacterised protein [Vibrio cholerae]CSB91680.1 Uncharacterised protein [Vibrio cholerae]
MLAQMVIDLFHFMQRIELIHADCKVVCTITMRRKPSGILTLFRQSKIVGMA